MSVTKKPSFNHSSSLSALEDTDDCPSSITPTHFTRSASFVNATEDVRSNVATTYTDDSPQQMDPWDKSPATTRSTRSGGSRLSSAENTPCRKDRKCDSLRPKINCLTVNYEHRPYVADFRFRNRYTPIAKVAKQVDEEKRTTIMIRNIPCRYEQAELMEELLEYKDLPFNFLYLPPARHSMGNLGYAFVNFVTPAVASKFIETWSNHIWRFQQTTNKRGHPDYATLQGFEANVKYYSKMKISRSRKCRPYVNYNVDCS
jgi:hypothetical protein